MAVIEPENTDVLILCGGRGTRLETLVNDRPKPMAEINGRPFLDLLIGYAGSYGYSRFILCTGYKHDSIEEYYRGRNGSRKILLSRENEPSGTAGAIKIAERLIESGTFLVMNGDSFCKLNLKEFCGFHFGNSGLASIALAPARKDPDYGVVKTAADNRVVDFSEKAESGGDGFINAGVYLFDRGILDRIPADKQMSLEYELMPGIIEQGVYGFATDCEVIDIGTPERFRLAAKILAGM
ncbi:MAG: NTP transferase domain-containing protein [Nitrospirae bacterium]|nr:NTP transferase domain-containing protein [Nitrospirota bacterium]